MPPYVLPEGPWKELRVKLASKAFRDAMSRGVFRSALHNTATELLAWMMREYNGLAKNRAGWKRIGVWTYALSSKTRVSTPVTTLTSLLSRTRNAKPLIDTGRMRDTLIRGKRYNIFQINNDSLRVGSSDPQLVKHQKEHVSVFTFGPKEQAALKRNVPPVVRGKSNSLYYMLRAMMLKAKGTSRTVAARPLPLTPPIQIVNRLRRRAVEAFKPILEDLFRP